MTQTDMDIISTTALPFARRLGRAKDELARALPVRLQADSQLADVYAADAVRLADLPTLENITVVLSGKRAEYLGLSADGSRCMAVTLPLLDEKRLYSLLYAERLTEPCAYLPADAMQENAVRLVRLAELLPAALLLPPQDVHAVSLNAEELQSYEAKTSVTLEGMVSLPIKQAEKAQLAYFRERGGVAHLALVIGNPKQDEAPLVRLHSSCMTGDILGSLRCDCGTQLKSSIQNISDYGHGVLLYLNQEGRGIGIFNKLRAYELQDKGLDTVDANLALGFNEDERDFALAAEMLKQLEIPAVRLLSNNPQKAEVLKSSGIKVLQRMPLTGEESPHNERYLKTKEMRMGHRYEAD